MHPILHKGNKTPHQHSSQRQMLGKSCFRRMGQCRSRAEVVCFECSVISLKYRNLPRLYLEFARRMAGASGYLSSRRLLLNAVRDLLSQTFNRTSGARLAIIIRAQSRLKPALTLNDIVTWLCRLGSPECRS